METFKSLREGTVLDALRDRNYKVYPEEIPGIIYSLYSYVGEDEDRIDEVIPVIELVAETSPAFKDEWYGAIEEAGGEVLEEGKLGKLATIAALALAAGISLTGCSPDVNIPPEKEIKTMSQINTQDDSKYMLTGSLVAPGEEKYEHFKANHRYTAEIVLKKDGASIDASSLNVKAHPMIEGENGEDVYDTSVEEATNYGWGGSTKTFNILMPETEGTEFGIAVHISGELISKDGSSEAFDEEIKLYPTDEYESSYSSNTVTHLRAEVLL